MSGLCALVPLDGTQLSESACSMLPQLKTLGFGKVRLVSVWESVWEEQESLPGRPAERQEVDEKGRSYLKSYLEAQAAHIQEAGLEAGAVLPVGRAGERSARPTA